MDPLPTWLSIILGGIAATIPQVVTSFLQHASAARHESRRYQQLLEQETRQARRDRESALWNLELDKFRALEAFLGVFTTSIYTSDNRGGELLVLQQSFSLGFLTYDTVGDDLKEILNHYVAIKTTPVEQRNPNDQEYLRYLCHEVIKNCRSALVHGLPHLHLPPENLQ